ncbi:hypothetical protein C8R45DRAFT_327596 [Mycena sanguinolenta]|nr:hypothetical protein C8R45DRAFT_327596 [Mycena sanguinolenta]
MRSVACAQTVAGVDWLSLGDPATSAAWVCAHDSNSAHGRWISYLAFPFSSINYSWTGTHRACSVLPSATCTWTVTLRPTCESRGQLLATSSGEQRTLGNRWTKAEFSSHVKGTTEELGLLIIPEFDGDVPFIEPNLSRALRVRGSPHTTPARLSPPKASR